MRGRVGSEAAPNSERRGSLFCRPQMPFCPSAFARRHPCPRTFRIVFRLRERLELPRPTDFLSADLGEINRHPPGWLVSTQKKEQPSLDRGVVHLARQLPGHAGHACAAHVIGHTAPFETPVDAEICRWVRWHSRCGRRISRILRMVCRSIARRCPQTPAVLRPHPSSSLARSGPQFRCASGPEYVPALHRNQHPDASEICARTIP